MDRLVARHLQAGALPWAITSGPDGNLWFTELLGNVGKITTDGTITEHPVSDASGIAGIAAAPSGDALWFTENDAGLVGSIGLDGTLGPEFLNAGYYPFGIAAGPGGNMWFAVGYTDEIGRVNVAPPPPFTPPKCVVPNVIGQKLAKAKAKIRKRHCRVGAITCRHSSPAMRGRVIRQAPKASGKRRPYGFRVRLTVGP